VKVLSTREQLPEQRSFILNLEDGPIRPVHLELLPEDRFGSLLVHFSEEACMIVSRVPPGGTGPLPHWHDVDQLFCCVSGELELRLGAQEVRLAAGAAAVIPAGTRHSHRNSSPEPEIHLEFLVPGVIPGRPVVHRVENDEPWTEQGRVVCAADGAAREGAEWIVTAGPASDARWVCALLSGDGPEPAALPALHTAQRWYVLDGGLEVDAPSFRGTAGVGDVVALPAEAGASVRMAPGCRTHLIGLWPRLDEASETALLAQLRRARPRSTREEAEA